MILRRFGENKDFIIDNSKVVQDVSLYIIHRSLQDSWDIEKTKRCSLPPNAYEMISMQIKFLTWPFT